MKKGTVIFAACSALISMLSLGAAAHGEMRMIAATPETRVVTAYFALTATEYRFPNAPRGTGGAIAVQGNDLILAAADGNFFRVDLQTMAFQTATLPALDLGASTIKASKRITLQELLPRVHDVVFFEGSVYVSHDFYDKPCDCIRFVISKLTGTDSAWKRIYVSLPLDAPYYALGTGGKLAISRKERRLYFTVGDYSLDRINRLPSDIAAQNPRLPWGKVNYLDLSDNRYHLFSIGHRNAQGLLLLDDGTLLVSEHGPQGGDELNVIQEGRNYGWPYRSYGRKYGSFRKYSDFLPPPAATEFEEPLFAFVPSIAPTQLIQVVGFDEEWKSDILLASLKAMSLFHIRKTNGRILYVEPILIGSRIRDLKQYRNTFILLTDDASLIVVRKD